MTWDVGSGSLDIATLHHLYSGTKISAVDIIEAVYRRIGAHTESGIWIQLMPKAEAIECAQRLEHLRKSDPATLSKLPLFGLPFAIKDNIDVANTPTTVACPDFAYTPAQSAIVVSRLVQCGAIPIGKTNMDQFATGLTGTRSPYGVCRNSIDRDYISGGSSSGSAVAVAAGLVTFALGTDTAGSGRVPAAFNNIVGLKPTHGLISTEGIFPANKSLDCVSIFGLNCADVERIFECACGTGQEWLVAASLDSAFRFGIPSSAELEFFGDREASGLFDAARRRLSSLGGVEVEIDFAPFAEAAALLYEGAWLAERYLAVKEFMDSHEDSVFPVTKAILNKGGDYSIADAFAGFDLLKAVRVKAEREWKKMDVLAVPTTGAIYTVKAVEQDPVALNSNLGRYTNFVNLLDYCAIAIPAGIRTNRLPFGISLIAPASHDRKLLNLGRAFCAPGPTTGISLNLNSIPENVDGQIQLAVVGAHLLGQPLNRELLELKAKFVRQTRTQASYRLYALSGTTPRKPGLSFVSDGLGFAIEVEIWELGVREFGKFVSKIPRPLGIGTLLLEDGTSVKGFICEEAAIREAQDISHFGSWRNYLSDLAGKSPK